MSQVSHIAQMRAQYAYNRKQVLFLTGMTDAMLSQFQFDTGLHWLTAYTTSNDDMLRWLLSQPIIWKWWLNEWNRRDEESLDDLYRGYEIMHKDNSAVLAKYRKLHQDCFVANAIPWTLLESGYNRAIGELNKEIRCHK